MISGKADNASCEPIETIRLSVLSGSESYVQFGRRVNVTVGRTVGRGGEAARTIQVFDVGTTVRITAKPANGPVAIMLSYETSRLEDNGEDDTPPEMITTQISTSQVLELGRPRLIGSSSSAATSVIVITITGN